MMRAMSKYPVLSAVLMMMPALAGAAEELALTRAQADEKVAQFWEERKAVLVRERAAELEAKAIVIGDKTLKFEAKEFGKAPEGGRSLWISMHGGGGAPEGQ
jgi:hypothetical protein